MDKFLLFSFFSFLSFSVHAQQLFLVDELQGQFGAIAQVDISQNGERFYNIENVSDSIIINGQTFQLPQRDSGALRGMEYEVKVGENQVVVSLEQFWTDYSFFADSSRMSLTSFNSLRGDTLHMQDTFFVNVANGLGSNLLVQEISFSTNERLSFKQWFTTPDSRYSISQALRKDGLIYFCGEYNGPDDLLLDNISLETGTGNGNAFLGVMNSIYEVLWLKSISGISSVSGNMITLNSHDNVLMTGFSESSFIYVCEDSMENKAITDLGTSSMYYIEFDSLGNCLEKKNVDYYYGNVIPSALSSFSSGSYLVSGDYFASYIGFDSMYLYNSSDDNIGFLAKLSRALEAEALFQLEGSPGFKSILSMIVDTSDHVIFTGYTLADTLRIGDEVLVNTTGDRSFDFIAVLDSNFNVISSEKLDGVGQQLTLGQDGNSYLLVTYPTGAHKLFRLGDILSSASDTPMNEVDLDVRVYPNPSKVRGKLYYDIKTEISESSHVEMYDAFGRLVLSQAILDNQGSLYVGGRKGVFLLEFTTNSEERLIKRIVVQ